MLKLLLDEHISPRVATGLRRRSPGAAVHAMAEWEGGSFLGRDDTVCLREAAAQRLTLVTYDRRTIPRLLKSWVEEGRAYAGVIFVDEKTIAPSDIGGLAASLALLIKEPGRADWTNRIVFLRR
jgi:hypothetical protein